MSGVIPFDSLFPVTSEPLVSHRLFGFNPVTGINEGVTVAQIISLLENTAPAWEDISGKPETFAPTPHTLGSHSDTSLDFDSATDGKMTKKIAGKWTPWTPNFLTEETDPTVGAHIKAITETEKANWNSAFAWGNPAGNYKPISWVPAWGDISGKPSAFAPDSHTLDSHSDASGLTAGANGSLIKKIAGVYTAWAPDYYSPSLPPPADPTVAAHVKEITIGQISTWNQKALEFVDFPDYTIPVFFQGIPLDTGIVGEYSVNPLSEEDPGFDPDFIPELLRVVFPVPVKGSQGVDPEDFVRMDQIESVNADFTESSLPVSFDLARKYGFTTPLTGNITFGITGAFESNMAKILHNHATAPTITGPEGVTIVKDGGTYVPSVDNIIYLVCHKNDSGTVIKVSYTITQAQ